MSEPKPVFHILGAPVISSAMPSLTKEQLMDYLTLAEKAPMLEEQRKLDPDSMKALKEVAAEMDQSLTLADLIQPLFGRIAVQVETKNEWTPAGLYIPIDTARTVHEQRATQGKVVAVSWDDDDPDDDEDLHFVSIGDIVLFGKYTGTKITWQPDRTKDRQDVIIMQERDALAVLHSPEQARNIKVKA